jgi:hypothetical protein
MAQGDITATNQFKAELLKGNIDLVNDTIKVALVNGYTFNVDNNHGYANFSANEISAVGYTAGGEALAGKTVTTNDGGDYGKWDANDVTWSSLATASISAALIYDDTITAPVADMLLAEMEITTNANGSNYKLIWNANGIVQLG